MLYESCQYWLFELGYKFLINQCSSTYLFKDVFYMPLDKHHNSNNNLQAFIISQLSHK